MIVETFKGEKVERTGVRRIKGEFYKHDDLVIYNNKRFRSTNNVIVRDYSADGRMIHLEMEGMPRRADVGGTMTIGRKTGELLIELYIGREVGDVKVFTRADKGGPESFFVTKEEIEESQFQSKVTKVGEEAYYISTDNDSSNRDLEYRCARYKGRMYDKLKYSLADHGVTTIGKNYKPVTNTRLNSLLGEYSIGVEFETEAGTIPQRELKEKGIMPLRDGSISGFEYVSIPLRSIDHLIDITEVVNRSCVTNFKNAFHVHVGTLPRTKEFLLKSFKVATMLQNEFYDMVPSYKKADIHRVKKRDHNYTNELPSIKITEPSAMAGLVRYLSDGADESESIETRPHPSDPSGNHKWQIKSRYKCINFVNYIYSKTGTIEFRLHQGTTNPYKVVYWTLLNVAILRYADMYSVREIENKTNISLNMVLAAVYPADVYMALNRYVQDQKKYFKEYDSEGDYKYSLESKEDKKWLPAIKLF